MWRTVIRYDRIRKNGVTLIYVFLYLPFVANLRIPSESRIFSIDLNLALYFLSDAMNIAHAGATFVTLTSSVSKSWGNCTPKHAPRVSTPFSLEFSDQSARI